MNKEKKHSISPSNNSLPIDTVSFVKNRQFFFDKHAKNWEESNYPPEIRNKLPDIVSAFNIRPETRIIDVGCGQGILIPYLRSEAGDNGHIIALDASAEMLKGAALKDSRTTVIKAIAENIPLIDEYLDAVVCFSAFPHFSDKEKAASEFFRILRPGGTAFIAHLGSREEINVHHSHHSDVAGDNLPCSVGMNKIFTSAGFVRTNLDERPGWYVFTAWKE